MSNRNGITFRSIGIYVRESRDDNEENYETIETQRELLCDYVSRNNLGRIYRVYEDDNVSGSSFERRGIMQVRGDAEAGQIDLLLIKDLSRLGRNNAKTLLFLDFLEEYNVRVLSFDGRYDSARDNDTVGIDTWYNERYIRDISRKIRANLRFKIEKGEYIGNAPYGYIKSSEQRNKLCIDPETAPIVREIYKLYREGYGYAFIARLLESRGHPAPSERNRSGGGGNGWNHIAVRRILMNRVYIGDTVQGISEKVSFKSKKTRRLPSERWVVTCGTHEPLVSQEEFDEVQRMWTKRSKLSGPHRGVIHMLRGLAYCGRCGSTMIARSRNNRPMGYICSRYNGGGKSACKSHHLNEKYITTVLKGELSELMKDSSVKEAAERLLEEEYLSNDDPDEEISIVEKQMTTKQRQQEILYGDRLEGKISEQLFMRVNSGIESRITALEHELVKLKSKRRRPESGKEILGRSMNVLDESGLTHEIVKLMVERITVFEAGDDLNDLAIEESQLEQATRNGAIVIQLRW